MSLSGMHLKKMEKSHRNYQLLFAWENHIQNIKSVSQLKLLNNPSDIELVYFVSKILNSSFLI